MILSQKGWIRARTGHGLDVSQLSFKDGDALAADARMQDHRRGHRARRVGQDLHVEAANMPSGRGDGAPVNTLVNSGSDDIVWMGAGDPQRRLLMNSSAGLGFLCKLGDLATKTRQGKDFMKVEEGASAQPPAFVPEKASWSQRCRPTRGCSCSRSTRSPSGRTAASACS